MKSMDRITTVDATGKRDTSRLAISSALRKICSAESYAQALDQVAIVAVTDTKGTIVYANERFARISKYAKHELIGQNHRILNSGEHSAAFFRAMYRTIAKGEVWRGELCNRAKDGSLYWVDTWIIPALGKGGKVVGYISIRVDITARKQAEAQQAELAAELKRQNDAIAHMTQHDALTGLANRLLLIERLRYALTGLSGSAGIAVLLIELDRFRDINDTLGHMVGDRLLKSAARRLVGCIGSRDTVARFGGDEFAIVQLAADPARDAAALARRILDAMAEPFEIDGRQLALGASVGIALPGDGAADPTALLRSADLALQRATCEAQGTYRFFEVAMDQRMQTRLELEVELRRAFAEGGLELHYQPLVNLRTRQVTSCEALLRWAHPSLGMVSPADFIPIAEETTLIVSIGDWVLHQACAEAARWPEPVRVSVNLSAAQFKAGNLVETVTHALQAAELPGSRLELEITESLLLWNDEVTLSTLADLRAMGVRVALDDFGIGYSSLAYLHSFAFDKIKIDRSFVSHLTLNKNAAAILHAIATLGHNLDIETTAEGVETEAQLEAVVALGCTEMQGNLFSHARPASELAQFFPKASAYVGNAA